MPTDGDMRMLGAVDGFAHVLVWLRTAIGQINDPYRPIDPRHVRKLAAREAILRPLRELEQRVAKSHSDTREAYDKSRH